MTAAMPAHWAARYIGLPWTPDFTCWHFCAQIWGEQFGWAMPAVAIDGADPRAVRLALRGGAERQFWQPVALAEAQDGDGVLMSKGVRPCHVGVWLELGGVLHCIEGAGGIYTEAARIGSLGYQITALYRRITA